MAGVSDCYVRHTWAHEEEIYEYLPRGWREYVLIHISAEWRAHITAGARRPSTSLVGPLSVHRAYRNPRGDVGADGAGRDPERLVRDHLDPNGIDAALLCHDDAVFAAGLPTVRLAVEIARAVNDWTLDRWVGADRRLHAAILVPTQAPEAAADEVYRLAGREGVAAVLMAAGGLGKPFGHPVYDPIHRAAHESGLPIVLASGGDTTQNSPVSPLAAGRPATYAELHTLGYQSLESHAASVLTQGVIGRYPSLRFILVGGGLGWVMPWLWRLDTNQRAFRHDLLWLGDRRGSDVVREHFLVGSHPFNLAASGETLRRYLEVDPELVNVFTYASGYPEWDAATPADVVGRLPAGWGDRVVHDNAARFVPWQHGVVSAKGAAA